MTRRILKGARRSLSPQEESPDSCCCLKPIAEVYSRSIHHACCWICRRHGIWASDLQCEDIAESGWLWKKSKVVGTWRLRWCCVVMSQRALLSFEEKPDWLHNTHLQQSPTEKIPLVTCDLNEFRDTSCPGFTIDNRAFALPGSAISRHALLNWLMAIAFVKGDEDTINRCVDLACEDILKEDFGEGTLDRSDLDSPVSTGCSNSADDLAIYVHGTTGDHVALDCLELADLWLVPVASNRAKTVASCELCHTLRARQDLCETHPCGHIFHVDCLYGWTRQSMTHDYCPHCQTTFVYEGDGDAAGGSYFPSSVMTFSYRQPVFLEPYARASFNSLPTSPMERSPPLKPPKKDSPPPCSIQSSQPATLERPLTSMRWSSDVKLGSEFGASGYF